MTILNKSLFALLLLIFTLGAWAAEGQGAAVDPATDAVIKALVERGVLSQEAAQALRQRIEQNTAAANPVTPVGKVPPATEELIKTLVEQGVLPKQTADVLQQRIEQNAAAKPAAAPAENVIRVPYVPEIVKDQIRDQIKQDVLAQAHRERWGDPGTLPDWIRRIRWDGDIRLRYERDMFAKDNLPQSYFNYLAVNSAGSTGAAGVNGWLNTTDDRTRWRLRARLGMLAKVSDGLEAGFRITTGSITNPVSTNQTLGNSFNRDTIVLDRAYLRADPSRWMTLWGGRIPNPWLSTELVWDENLNFDGVAANLRPSLSDSTRGFLTLGAFPLQQVDLAVTSGSDKWLYGAQLGLDQDFSRQTNAKIGLAYYDYRNITGVPNPVNSPQYNFTAPQFVQKGNTMFNMDQNNTLAPTELYGLAAKFHELDLTAMLDLAHFDPVHVTLTLDYVKNLGYDSQSIMALAPGTPPYGNKARLYKLAVGMPQVKQRGDWQVITSYRHIESDAVLDAYTDADFHLGGTDAKGWTLSGSYGVARDSWVSLKYLSADAISGPPLGIDVLQLDFNARF
ncbi:MAG: putative porin [Sulfuricaulis sp.]